MKSGVAKHLGVARIHQQNGLVDETNMTLFAKCFTGIWVSMRVRNTRKLSLFGSRYSSMQSVAWIEFEVNCRGSLHLRCNLGDVARSRFNKELLAEVISKWKAGIERMIWHVFRSDVYVSETPESKEKQLRSRLPRVDCLSKGKSYVGEHQGSGWFDVVFIEQQHMEALSTTEAGYLTFTEAWKKEIWLKGLLTELGYELRLVAGLVLGKRQFPVRGSNTGRRCCVSVLTNSDTKVEIVRYNIHSSQ
ncbi:hypothetical protein Tco_0565708 [Tanacetum coccineum]